MREVEAFLEPRVGAASGDRESCDRFRDEGGEGKEPFATLFGGFEEICKGALSDDRVEGRVFRMETFGHDEDRGSHGFAQSVKTLAALPVHPGRPVKRVVLLQKAVGHGVAAGFAMGAEVGSEDRVLRCREPGGEALAAAAPSTDAMEDKYTIANLWSRKPGCFEGDVIGGFDRNVLRVARIGNDLARHVQHLEQRGGGHGGQGERNKKECAGCSNR